MNNEKDIRHLKENANAKAKAKSKAKPKQDIKSILARVHRPKKALITSGMPYANAPLHVGHLAGALVPPDIFARWMRLLIGKENVLFVSGSDEHGSTSEVAAKKAGMETKEFIKKIHDNQNSTLKKYNISHDIFTGTSQEENYEQHKTICQEFLTKLYNNKMLEKKSSEQWFDTELNLFLPDRYVQGQCPNPNCSNQMAYSDECDVCGNNYDPSELINAKSSISDCTPILKSTEHWYLDMWKVTDQLVEWISTKMKTWRKYITSEVMGTVLPSFIFSNIYEEKFKELREKLPKHKTRYAPGKKIVVQFFNLSDLETGKIFLIEQISDIDILLINEWAHRSITRDVSWAIPVPTNLEKGMENKTLYVWPESLIAPISFTKVALKSKGLDPETYKDYWTDPEAKIYQFLGVDNVFFYVLMQGSMWFGTQENPFRMPMKGELQLTEIFSSYHLQLNGQKMSKSKGNFYTADQLLEEYGYTSDQIRYFLSILSLSEKSSNFDFETLNQRNEFLAGPLNAALEKPISALHSKFNGEIPKGKFIGKTEKETIKIIQSYCRFMEKAEYPKALFAIENYARIINSLFNQYKPHDDRFPIEQRNDAIYSCFYILKNISIMLEPFVPDTMKLLRESLNITDECLSIDDLGTSFKAGHKISKMNTFFPSCSV